MAHSKKHSYILVIEQRFREIIHFVISTHNSPLKSIEPVYSCFILIGDHQKCTSTALELARETGDERLWVESLSYYATEEAFSILLKFNTMLPLYVINVHSHGAGAHHSTSIPMFTDTNLRKISVSGAKFQVQHVRDCRWGVNSFGNMRRALNYRFCSRFHRQRDVSGTQIASVFCLKLGKYST